MDILVIYIIKTLILPPASLLIVGIYGLLIHKKQKKLGFNLIAISIGALFFLSLPLITGFLATTQEIYPALKETEIKHSPAEAVVVLGGGTRPYAPEYNHQFIIHERVFDRLRYASRIAKMTGLPLLVSGGKVVDQGQPSEAQLMQDTLVNDFQFKANWLEDKSRNTAENAQYSFELLNQESINKIILVTHALHMARAVEQFENVGFQVTPAPTAFISVKAPVSIFDFLPSASALDETHMVLHEMLGRWWYKIRY